MSATSVVAVIVLILVALLRGRNDGEPVSANPQPERAPALDSVPVTSALPAPTPEPIRSEPELPDAARDRAQAAPVTVVRPMSEPEHVPFLSMRIDREELDSAFLRIVFVGEPDATLSGVLEFEVQGLPRRTVEFHGRGVVEERELELRVPACVDVSIVARLDGLVVAPLGIVSPGPGEWLELRMPISMSAAAAHLELELIAEAELEGVSFFVQLNVEAAGEITRKTRSPAVVEGRLAIGGLPAGRIGLVAHELAAVQRGLGECLVLTAQTTLAPGERALVLARVERSGTVRVLAVPGERTPESLSVGVLLPNGATYRPSWRTEGTRSTRLRPGESMRLIPPLPPGSALLRIGGGGPSPIERELWIRSGEVAELEVRLDSR